MPVARDTRRFAAVMPNWRFQLQPPRFMSALRSFEPGEMIAPAYDTQCTIVPVVPGTTGWIWIGVQPGIALAIGTETVVFGGVTSSFG